MDLLGRHAVDFTFRDCNPMKHSHGLLLDPRGEFAPRDQVADFRVIAAMLVRMPMFLWAMVMVMVMAVIVLALMVMFVASVLMLVMVVVRVTVRMRHSTSMCVLVRMGVRASEMDVELKAFDGRFVSAPRVQVKALHAQFFQLVFELVKVDAKINQGADEHIAADAAENIEVKSFHPSLERPAANAFIWLAA
jgi:hypothetical protein